MIDKKPEKTKIQKLKLKNKIEVLGKKISVLRKKIKALSEGGIKAPNKEEQKLLAKENKYHKARTSRVLTFEKIKKETLINQLKKQEEKIKTL